MLFILMLVAMAFVVTGSYIFISSYSYKAVGSSLMAVGVLAEMVVAFMFLKTISRKA